MTWKIRTASGPRLTTLSALVAVVAALGVAAAVIAAADLAALSSAAASTFPSGQTATAATPSPSGGLIYFAQTTPNHLGYTIASIRPDGTAFRVVYRASPAVEGVASPTYSHALRKVVFESQTSNYALEVVPAAGGPAAPLPHTDSQLFGIVSPDGKRLLMTGYSAPASSDVLLEVQNLDGSGRRILQREGSGGIPAALAWQGNGTVRYTRNGDIWSIPIGGGTPHRLTNLHTFFAGAAPFDRPLAGSESADGRQVALSSKYSTVMFVIRTDGGSPRRLPYVGNMPSLSPDGSQIAFAGRDGNGIYVGRSDGTGTPRLIWSGAAQNPNWAKP